MLEASTAGVWVILVFLVGYLAIIFEYNIKINKTATALVMAVLAWMFLFLSHGATEEVPLGHKLNEVSQIIFFLLGAMTLVELIDSHKGFKVITDLIHTSSKKKMVWIIGLATFFLSSILDNLTSTIVMVSLLRKLIVDRRERALLGALVVIAANAGGAWTPIGDVTTTMLWINGNITSVRLIVSLFIPSVLSLVVAILLFGRGMKGRHAEVLQRAHEEKGEPGSQLVFFAGLGALVAVPLFKAATGLPPFMGMLVALGLLWLVTDLLHSGDETRHHLRVPHILTRIDTSGILFFLGILLCVSALDTAGALSSLATQLDLWVGNTTSIATLIGLISAVIDNVPLVAASMGMYSLDFHPTDSPLWMMIAFCAGTGGSILVIGSAAGVAFMGLEKIDFLWYLKNVSLIALISYFSGIGAYLFQLSLFG